jgi:hypothetical protein
MQVYLREPKSTTRGAVNPLEIDIAFIAHGAAAEVA